MKTSLGRKWEKKRGERGPKREERGSGKSKEKRDEEKFE